MAAGELKTSVDEAAVTGSEADNSYWVWREFGKGIRGGPLLRRSIILIELKCAMGIHSL